MGLTNIKHRIYGGLGRIGVPLLILALFTWGLPRTAEAHHHYGYGYGFGGHRYGYAPTPLEEVAKVARLAGLGALNLNNVKPKKTAVYLNGQYIGVTGDFDGYSSYLWLKKGTHQLSFYKDGYRTLAREYTIHPGVVIAVASMQPGKQVAVKLHQGMGKKVKGTFVASGADGITVHVNEGQELTVPWYRVRNLTANRKVTLQLERGESVPPREFAAASAD